MARRTVRLLLVFAFPVAIFALLMLALNGEASTKPYAEGEAGIVEPLADGGASLSRAGEGLAGDRDDGVLEVNPERGYPEGQGGATGVATGDRAAQLMSPAAPDALSVRLQFSGVTDDGKKGASDRKEATSILCTNAGTANADIKVELYQWSGSLVYTGTVTAAPKASYTFSTQNTTIYFDDVIFGTGGGTDSIFQGFGRVLSNRATVVCTAEVLDPAGYPPVFVSGLEIYRP